MPDFVDLRSDTVTRPSAQMRKAMYNAEVGDDVLGDDPTVHRLEALAASLMGKEAGLLMASGTMSNAVAIKSLTHSGDEILLDSEAHSMLYEAGMPASIANVLTRQFHSVRGIPDVAQIAEMIHVESLHSPGTRLIIIENTHNRAGGTAIPTGVLKDIYTLARDRGLSVHLDGARIFNAALATDVPAAEIAGSTDTVTFCLSKGLGCPIGSVLCGNADLITRARRVRKMLGGGMRQAGVVAAAGIWALENNISRLSTDHDNARRLASGLASISGLSLDGASTPTNMVYVKTHGEAPALVDELRTAHGVLCGSTGPRRIRLVTHLDVNASDIDRAITAVAKACSRLSDTNEAGW